MNLEGVMAAQRGDPGSPSEEIVTELQLQTARTLRQVCYMIRSLFFRFTQRRQTPIEVFSFLKNIETI